MVPQPVLPLCADDPPSARANDGDGDWVSVVDNDTNDFVSGGEGTEDVCVVDLVNGENDEFSDTCEKVYQTASIPQE